MNNCGFTEYQSKAIEANYHKMYVESNQWIKLKLDQCCIDGYATAAFGLRIRTPLLAKSILNNGKTPHISAAEARSVGNAISGQSYGLLNNRAAIAFMHEVWASEYKYDIFPVSLIHDAIYLHIKDDINVLKFVNDKLIEAMAWQDLPEIAHPQVKLEANLDLFHPDWSSPIKIPNKLSTTELKAHIQKSIK